MNDQCIARFWENYINKTVTYNITPKMARWYVRFEDACGGHCPPYGLQ